MSKPTSDDDAVSLRPETAVVHAGRPAISAGGPLNEPLVLASNFHTDVGEQPDPDARVYARGEGTATWEALESAVGALEGGSAIAFSSGMAAAAAVLDLMPTGSTLVLPTDCYFGVGALADRGATDGRWTVVRVNVAEAAATEAALDGADLLWLESPTNPMMAIADLATLADAGRAAGALVAVDNTFASPLLQQPLELGADISMHSATKFIGGHSDLLAGLVLARDEELVARIRRRRELAGATPGALESYLALRGLRTLALRVQQGQRSAGELAERLTGHPAVGRVRYPGLADDPGHDLASRQMTGFGAVLAFEMADADTADRVCAQVRVITAATSLGGVETTIERRSKLPGAHIPRGLLRLSVGCEHVEDLWSDLRQALERAAR